MIFFGNLWGWGSQQPLQRILHSHLLLWIFIFICLFPRELLFLNIFVCRATVQKSKSCELSLYQYLCILDWANWCFDVWFWTRNICLYFMWFIVTDLFFYLTTNKTYNTAIVPCQSFWYFWCWVLFGQTSIGCDDSFKVLIIDILISKLVVLIWSGTYMPTGAFPLVFNTISSMFTEIPTMRVIQSFFQNSKISPFILRGILSGSSPGSAGWIQKYR